MTTRSIAPGAATAIASVTLFDQQVGDVSRAFRVGAPTRDTIELTTRGHAEERAMKLISSIVRPERVVEIRAALRARGVQNTIVIELHDCGSYVHGASIWRGHEYTLSSSPRMAMEVVVDDDDVDAVVGTIIRLARTGEIGDGHVSVISLEHRYDIRTGLREVS